MMPPTCPRCGYELLAGQALAQTHTGSPDFIGGPVVTLSYGGPGKIIPCLKCPTCGYSEHPDYTCDAQGRGD